MFSGAANKRMSNLVEVLLSTGQRARPVPTIRTKLSILLREFARRQNAAHGPEKAADVTQKALTSMFLAANMPAANMREDGVPSISATCETCQHEAVLNADDWPADMPVPDIGLKLRCSACGGRAGLGLHRIPPHARG